MNDRGLLEAAARAAGFDLVLWHPDGTPHATIPGGTVSARWNPLTDDGDALRLAVALDIEIYQGDDDGPAVFAGYWGKPERRDVTRMFCIEAFGDDKFTATRRAIVRAAAATAKG